MRGVNIKTRTGIFTFPPTGIRLPGPVAARPGWVGYRGMWGGDMIHAGVA